MIAKVGFIGVGAMGEPMAANLLRAGFAVQVMAHRNRAPVERLLAQGATEGETPRELGAHNDLVMVCISNDEAVRQVTLGKDGLVHAGHPGLIVVDASTISPLTSQEVAESLKEAGIHFLDAPISGGQGGAQAGTLSIMVGGPEDSYEQALPVLQAMGSSVTYIGANGSALVVKLSNNLIVGAMLTAISEGLTLAAKCGVEADVTQQVLSTATARSWILQERVPSSLLAGNLEPGFKLELMRKDMGLAQDLGHAAGVPMFLTALVHQLYTQAEGLGKGELDCFAISQLYTDATGVNLASGDQTQ